MPNLEEYTIGWICAINTEFVAARALLDESHGKPEGVAQNDNNNYALGRMGQHNVVIAVLPKGEYGTTTAATVARNMVHSFPNVRIGLMVGIAGGAPSENHDIRLGDIVVSSRSGGKGGVFQYDYGKSMQNGSFVETGALNQPPQVLLAAVNGLEADYAMDGHQLDSKIEEALKRYPRLRKSHSRPPGISDRLYQPNVTHPPDSTLDCLQACSDDPVHLVPRHQRSEYDDNPAIHFGLIASGNQVIKNAQVRDKLAIEKEVLCFEMEAAGLMNHFPCLVVRGICDYSDTHKNQSWQGFAAMVAAAYAKDVLCQMSSTKVELEQRLAETLRSIEANQTRQLHSVNDLKLAVEEIGTKQQTETIKRWLAPPDPSTNVNRARELRHKGTGNWFLESPVFREWESDSRRCLWLHGLPGCGKTVLLTTAYDCIAQEAGRVTLYFFFDFGDERKQTLDNLLQGLIFQLYTIQGRPTSELDDLFKRCNYGKDQPDSSALSNCLQQMLKGSSNVYILVDALDECTQRMKLLNWMEAFLSVPDLNHVKLMMTARPEVEFNSQIPLFIQERNCISLQTESINADIRSYVRSSLVNRPGFKKWISMPSMLQKVSCEVGSKAGGMFRWAACQLDSLETCIDQQEIEAALVSLPESLNETYKRIVQSFSPHRRDRAIRLLQFLVFSPRPFTLREAMDIVAVRPQGFNAEDRMPEPENILQFCPGLISIVQTTRNPRDPNLGDSEATKGVQLAHFSVKEYLLTVQESFQPVQASINILRTCFAYYWSVKEAAVEFENKSSLPTSYSKHDVLSATAKQFPLLEFVVLEWMNFVRLAEEPEEMVEIAADVLADSRDPALWRDWENPLKKYGSASWEQCGLYFACRKKLHRTARALMQRNVDVNTVEGCIAALQGASYSGLYDVAQQLLDMIPQSESQEGTYGGALQIASKEGHYNIVNLLLSHGAEVQSPKNRFCDAFAIVGAAGRGHRQVVELLLVGGADVNTRDGYDDPLSAASRNGFQETVELLLEHGADVRLHGRALTHASEGGYDGIVRLLLSHGADVNAFGPYLAENALLVACRCGHLEIVKQLLDHGADVNVRGNSFLANSSWNTPLLIAVSSGHIELARVLLQLGADVNAQGETACGAVFSNEWDTALQNASGAGCLDLVQLLVEYGADVNSQCPHGNALTAAICAKQNQKEIIQFLLQSGADCNAQSAPEHTDYNNSIDVKFDLSSPLSTAVYVNSPDFVRLLLDHGSDPNGAKIGLGSTGEPLCLAFGMRGREEIIKLLIKGGADPNQLYRSGRPILYSAVERGYYEITKLLVQYGADINHEDLDFSEIVWVAFRQERFDIAVYLLQKAVELKIPRKEAYLVGLIPPGFLGWAAQYGVPDIPELSEEVSRLSSTPPWQMQ